MLALSASNLNLILGEDHGGYRPSVDDQIRVEGSPIE